MSHIKKSAADNLLNLDGYKVITVIPRTQQQLDFLKNMAKVPQKSMVEFWSQPSELDRPCDLMVPPDALNTMTSTFTSLGMRWNISINNVESEVEGILNPARSTITLPTQYSPLPDATSNGSSFSQYGGNMRRNNVESAQFR